jgi:hypothetical protein
VCTALLAAAPASPECTTSHVHLGDHPALARVPWSNEAQGITHDEAHWFLTTRSRLFKVPAAVDLASDPNGSSRSSGVLQASIPGELRSRGFDHFGDLSWTTQQGVGVLCAPLEGEGLVAELAFFRASDLAYLGSAALPSSAHSAPFCAIDGGGHLVVGQARSPDLARYSVDWSDVTERREVVLARTTDIRLRDERGAPLAFEHLQGAAFSEDARRLYVIHGFFDDHACAPWERAFWTGSCSADPSLGGIHVFELGACASGEPCEASRIERSTNPLAGGEPSSFTYAYRATVWEAEEPEGITVWDLESPGAPLAPRVRGQVHALMLDNELVDGWDRVSIRHYRAEVRCSDPGQVPASPR